MLGRGDGGERGERRCCRVARCAGERAGAARRQETGRAGAGLVVYPRVRRRGPDKPASGDGPCQVLVLGRVRRVRGRGRSPASKGPGAREGQVRAGPGVLGVPPLPVLVVRVLGAGVR